MLKNGNPKKNGRILNILPSFFLNQYSSIFFGLPFFHIMKLLNRLLPRQTSEHVAPWSEQKRKKETNCDESEFNQTWVPSPETLASWKEFVNLLNIPCRDSVFFFKLNHSNTIL